MYQIMILWLLPIYCAWAFLQIDKSNMPPFHRSVANPSAASFWTNDFVIPQFIVHKPFWKRVNPTCPYSIDLLPILASSFSFFIFTTPRLQVCDGESLPTDPVPVSSGRAVWTHRHRQRHLYLSRRVHRTRLQHRRRRMWTMWVIHHIIEKERQI